MADEPDKSLFENALKYSRSIGYKTDIGPNVYADKGVGISNTPEKCADELEDYYANHGDVIISVGGCLDVLDMLYGRYCNM